MGQDKQAKGGRRSSARLAAAQALYQMEMNETPSRIVIGEFIRHRFGQIVDDIQFSEADGEFFTDIVSGAEERHEEIDKLISASLSDDWTLERVESVARAVLRVGTYEIIARPDVPTKVIINEYIDVTKAFFEDSTPAFVNGVLDKISKQIRN